MSLKSLQDKLKTLSKRNQQLTSRCLENTDPERVKHRYTVPPPQEFCYYYEEQLKGATVMLADGTTFVIEGITSDYYESSVIAVISRNPSEEYNKKYNEWVIARDQWVDNTINAFIKEYESEKEQIQIRIKELKAIIKNYYKSKTQD